MAGRKVQYIIDVDEKGAVTGARKTEKALENVDKQAQRTGKSGTQMAAQMQNAGKGVADLDRNSRGANQVLFSMSDAIQDASFAGGNLADISRYAGNNVAVAAEQFAVMSARAGGSKAALQSVIGSFFGVGGLITALNLGLVALNLFGDGMNSVEDDTESLNEDVDTLITNWEKTIELQEKFGAFDDDEIGLATIDAKLKEASEDLSEVNRQLEKAQEAQRKLDQFRRKYGGDGGPLLLTEELSRELIQLEAQVNQYEDISDLQEERKTLQKEINDLAEERVDTTTSLLDSDTQQAKTAQEIREEKERQLSLERMIADARRSTIPDQPEDQIMGMDINIPDAPDMDLTHRLFPPGSLGELREKLRSLREELVTATDPKEINRLNNAIGITQDQMSELQGKTKETGNEMAAQMVVAAGNAMMYADTMEEAMARAFEAIAQVIIAEYVKNALITAGASGPLAFAVSGVLAGLAVRAGRTLVDNLDEKAQGGLARGPSHAQGGMIGMIGGKPAFEFEGGEAIINRKSTQMFLPQLNAINQAGGGVPLAADGALTLNNISRDAGPLPMIGGGSSLEGVLSKLTQVLENGITATTDLTEFEDAQSRMDQKAKALGNA